LSLSSDYSFQFGGLLTEGGWEEEGFSEEGTLAYFVREEDEDGFGS
jgi:hypothetical protein